MTEKIICDICKKEIKANDEIILGSKDDYTVLPNNIKSSNIVFLHTDCFKQYLKNKEELK